MTEKENKEGTQQPQGLKQAGQENPPEGKPTYDELLSDNERKDGEIRRLHGLLRANQRQSITRDDFQSLTQLVNDNLLYSAQMMDNLKGLVVSQLGENAGQFNPQYNPQQEKSFTEQVQERQKIQQDREKQPDPDTQAFAAYMTSQGLNWDSQEVQEAIYDENGQARTGKDALAQLKTSVETKREAGSKAQRDQEISLAVENKIKDMGLAGAGVNAPNAPSGQDLNKMSGRQLIAKGLQEQADKEKQE